MAVLFCDKCFEQGISGTTAIQTTPEKYAMFAQAEKFFLQARATQVSGTSPTLTVAIEHSNDGVTWTTKATPISAFGLSAGAINGTTGSDLGTAAVGGAKVRLTISLAGTTPSAFVEIWLTGRSND